MLEFSSRLPGLMNNSDALFSVFDNHDRLKFANPAFRIAFALGENEYPTWADLLRSNREKNQGIALSCDDFEKWLMSAASRRGKSVYRAFETDLLDGRWLWMTETLDKEGWMLCVAVDITALAINERELRHDRDLALRASWTDELTGVSNRRFVMGKLEQFVKQKTPACLAVLDIDRFKMINDSFGHQTGDAVLTDFARRVSQSVRRTDCFGRIGGEEFLFLMPDTGAEEAIAIVERIRSEAATHRLLVGGRKLSYSFSAGVAELRADDTVSSAFSRADAACYEAKQQGRDRVSMG